MNNQQYFGQNSPIYILKIRKTKYQKSQASGYDIINSRADIYFSILLGLEKSAVILERERLFLKLRIIVPKDYFFSYI